MKDVAVVPVKGLPEAKRRLSNYLDPDERRRLVLAMLEDVLHSLEASDVFSKIIVISPDGSLEKNVRRNQGVFVKQRGAGLNAAIRQASRELLPKKVPTMMTILADLPLAAPKDFEELARISGEKPRIVLAPSLKGGTNVMLRSPPDVISTSYGRWSYAKHLRAGQRRGIPVYSISNSRLSFDVDTIQDLKVLRRLDRYAKTHAGRLAREIGRLPPVRRDP